MQCLNKKEFLLSLPQELNALLVVTYDHCCEDFVSFALRTNLEMAPPLLPLLYSKILGLDTKLVVELPALLKAFYAIISIPFNILKQTLRSLLVREEHVLNDVESEDLLLELLFVSVELLLFYRYFTCQHGLSSPLLLACQLPVLKVLDPFF